jgi:hypothetical protein
MSKYSKVAIGNDEVTVFTGTVIFGLSSQGMSKCAVYPSGMLLDFVDPEKHHWPGNKWEHTGKVVRHRFTKPEEVVYRDKAELSKILGLSKLGKFKTEDLKSSQRGHKFYKDTDIGDVLYITFDTNFENWQEAIKVGFVDKHCCMEVNK